MDSSLWYKEEILDHYRNPLHFGKPKQYSHCAKQLNPFCGDEIEIFIQLKKKKNNEEQIAEIGFLGKGCAISIASCSILTDFAKNKTKKTLTNFTQQDMLSLLGIEISDTRKKCALLGLSVLYDCLNKT